MIADRCTQHHALQPLLQQGLVLQSHLARRALYHAIHKGRNDRHLQGRLSPTTCINKPRSHPCQQKRVYSQLAPPYEPAYQQNELDEAVKKAVNTLEHFWATRHERLATLRRLSREVDTVHIKQRRPSPASIALRLPEANAGPVPHEIFKSRLTTAHENKTRRTILRTQLFHCDHPRQIYKVIAVAFKHPETFDALYRSSEPLIRALYRCRRNVTDPEVLAALIAIIGRCKLNHIAVHEHLYQVALKFAARSRSLTHMKKLLRWCREQQIPLTSNTIRSIIAKFSIGHRGLGEIRNGRWRRSDLLQVLRGFDDCVDLPVAEQFHLATFLIRDDWQCMHGYIAALARCRDVDALWREWAEWKLCEARVRPRRLRQIRTLNTRTRGDAWFVVQMAHAGALEAGWAILRESGLALGELNPHAQSQLLQAPEFANVEDCKMRERMVRNLEERLVDLEAALGLVWVADRSSDDVGNYDGNESSDGLDQGRHVFVVDREEILERISAVDWVFEPDHGFPYADQDMVSSADRCLRDAVETTLVEPEDYDRTR